MEVFLALLTLAASVKQGGAALRSSCEANAPVIAMLSPGEAVTLGFSVAGESLPCYKVTVAAGGRTLQGYLPEAAIDGLESFEEARREAAWIPVSAAPAPETAPVKPSLDQLVSSGITARHGGDAPKALEYWRAALEAQPNPDLAILYRRVEREAKNDLSTEKLYGIKIELRYEPGAIPVETARQMLAALDGEFIRISQELGCSSENRLVAIAQSPEAFRKTTDAAEWMAGLFDGRIRVPVFDAARLDANLRRTLAHETAHACLAMTGSWPAWLHEGLAQKLSGDTVTAPLSARLTQWAGEGKLPRLANLRQDWSRLDSEHARYAYALALAAVELFYTDFGPEGIRNLLHSPEHLPAIAAELDARLGLN